LYILKIKYKFCLNVFIPPAGGCFFSFLFFSFLLFAHWTQKRLPLISHYFVRALLCCVITEVSILLANYYLYFKTQLLHRLQDGFHFGQLGERVVDDSSRIYER